jgi:hypothetical protein
MIGKQVKGRGFRGCLNYLLEKEGSQIIGGNMSGQTPRQLAAEFRWSRQLNPRVQRAVYHVSLSVLAAEKLSDDQWRSLADDYLQQMGFNQNQYVIVRHTDTDHNHIHIVASRIRLDGSCVSDSWDYRRSEQIVRQLEQRYQLDSPACHNRDRRSPSTSERRMMRRTGESSIRQQLQDAIDATCQIVKTLPELIDHLQERGIETSVQFTRTGHIQGICYQLNDLTFSGTDLGKAYTFPGLQKYRSIDYQPTRDDPLLRFSSPHKNQLSKPDSHTASMSILRSLETSQNLCLE